MNDQDAALFISDTSGDSSGGTPQQAERAYKFRREDTGEVIDVDFASMMEMDACGYITLPDGVVARRCRRLEQQQETGDVEKIIPLEKPILSDSLGFCETQLAEFEADRVANGFTGIEFVPEPGLPFFYQVKCSGKEEWKRYLRHRNMRDNSKKLGSAATLTPKDIEEARQRILEKYPVQAGLSH